MHAAKAPRQLSFRYETVRFAATTIPEMARLLASHQASMEGPAAGATAGLNFSEKQVEAALRSLRGYSRCEHNLRLMGPGAEACNDLLQMESADLCSNLRECSMFFKRFARA